MKSIKDKECAMAHALLDRMQWATACAEDIKAVTAAYLNLMNAIGARPPHIADHELPEIE